jgi:hypothetical protein
MKYWLGPWVWHDGRDGLGAMWRAPVGTVGLLDFGTLPEMANGAGADRPAGMFCTPDGVNLGSAYTLIASGDCREIQSTGRILDLLEAELSYRPQGVTLADLLSDVLVGGSDPAGESGPKPLMPTMAGSLELHLGGHSRVWRQSFAWGSHAHKGRVRDALRLNFRRAFTHSLAEASDLRALATALPNTWQQVNSSTDPLIVASRRLLRWCFERGWTVTRTRDRLGIQASRVELHPRKLLGFWLRKFRLRTDWQEFVPQDLQGEIAGDLPPETTITESFNTSDGSTLGPDLSWSEFKHDSPGVTTAADTWEVVGNQATPTSTMGTTGNSARADSALSGDDHYAQTQVAGIGSGTENAQIGVACRMVSGALCDTWYVARALQIFDIADVIKNVGDAITTLGTGPYNITTTGLPKLIKLEADGSTLSFWFDGVLLDSITDTSITGNTRCGIFGYESPDTPGTAALADSFEAADLAGAGPATNRRRRLICGAAA